ncbi:cell envelope integrity protein CreD [Chitinibacter sp. GC72]|uniref:cell envelope integrity protein CreD n=1 Tax=Chitinibacter sp. GC72 TaxID=1526917 RepID=UPI0012FCAEA7|nr:cell envelope integrity protein CreD [Chitinibacter sp. GC72]
MKIGMKLAAMLGLMVLMLVVLAFVRDLVSERQQRADTVRSEIAQFSAGEQTLLGPFLVLPYVQTSSKLIEATKDKASYWEDTQVSDQLVLTPSQFDARGQLAVEVLKRGLFEAPIYRSQLQLSGRFAIPALGQYEAKAASARERITTQWQTPYLALGLSDVRGIQQLSGVAASQTLTFAPGARHAKLGGGVHAPLALAESAVLQQQGQQLDFNFKLNLAGSTQLLIEPVGDSSQIALSGNWPHPSFAGNFAPLERTITANSFSARWQTSELATGGSMTMHCNSKDESQCNAARVGLRLIDPVDRYVLNERTMKYAELFMLLIFGAVFLMEVMHKLSVHPVQYSLVGLGLAMFFLLTLSLSEHIGFNKAYWLAALASAALQGFYISFVLAGWRRGLGFAAVLVALYGLLFGILQSEDMALLMGSLTMFALLACVMYFTRNIDWKELGGNTHSQYRPSKADAKMMAVVKAHRDEIAG